MYDNKAIISIAHNPIQKHDRIKDIEIDTHFIKDRQ